MSEIINITRGSDVNLLIAWQDTDGAPFDLTGWSVQSFGAHPLLDGNLTLQITNAKAGEIGARIEWDDRYATGRVMGFQIWMKRGVEDRTSQRYWLDISPDHAMDEHPISTVIMGPAGSEGPPGVGVPAGGAVGQILVKSDGGDYATAWVDPASGGDEQGPPGEDGASAYQIAVTAGFVGTEAEWLASLRGPQGGKGDPGADSTVPGPEGPAGADGRDGMDGADSTVPGPQGDDGKSAYDLAIEGGFVGAVADWLASLEGPQGESGKDGANGTDGADGASAYQVAVADGFAGTETDWLASLKGANGNDGADGADGNSVTVHEFTDEAAAEAFAATAEPYQITVLL